MGLIVRVIFSFLAAVILFVALIYADAPSLVPLFASIVMFIASLIFSSKGFQKSMEEDRIRKKELRKLEEEERARETGRLQAQKEHEERPTPRDNIEGMGSSPIADIMLGQDKRGHSKKRAKKEKDWIGPSKDFWK